MSNIPHLNWIIAVVVILILIFVPVIRSFVFGVLRIGIALVAAFIAIAGVTMLMNNETVYEKPGVTARAIRFVSYNEAASSEKGLGSATCSWPDQPAPPPAPAAAPPAVTAQKNPPQAAPSATPTPAEEEEEVYPELITRNFPGIQREKVFEISEQTANSLPGWKVVKSDARSGTIECTRTSRILASEDDVRITVTPKGDVEVCSRSGAARPNSSSWLRFFPGDFGANIGHIKQFYETLEPKMDAIYKEEQEKQEKEKAKRPRGG